MHPNDSERSPRARISGNIAGMILLLSVVATGCLIVYFLMGRSREERQPLTQVERNEPATDSPEHKKSEPPASRWRSVNADSLRFQITPEKATWQIGETVTIQCAITNIGEKPLSFAPLTRPPDEIRQGYVVFVHMPYLETFVLNMSGLRAETIEETHRSIGIKRSGFPFMGGPRSLRDEELVIVPPGTSWKFTQKYLIDWHPGKYTVHLNYAYYPRYAGVDNLAGPDQTANPNAWQGEVVSNPLDVVIEGILPPLPTYSDDEIFAIIADPGQLPYDFIQRPNIRQRFRENPDFFLPKIVELYKDADFQKRQNAEWILWDVYEEMAVPVALQLLENPDIEIQKRALVLIGEIAGGLLKKSDVKNLSILREKVTEVMLKDQDLPIIAFFGALGRLQDDRMVLIFMEMINQHHQWASSVTRGLKHIVGSDSAWPKEKNPKGQEYPSDAREWWEKSGKHKTWPQHPRHKEITEKIEHDVKADERR